MIETSLKEQFSALLNFKKLKGFPEIVPISTPVIEVMEKTGIYWPAAHKNPQMMAELALGMSSITKTNCINIPFDMVIEAEALGCDIKWHDYRNSTPQVSSIAHKDADEIKIDEKILTRGRFPVVLKSLEIIKEKNTNDSLILPLVCGPFTVASHTFGVDYMFKLLIKDQSKFIKILNLFKELAIIYSLKLLEAGADYILMLSPNESGIGGREFNEIFVPVYKNISKSLDRKIILHICGRINRIIDYLPYTEIPAFSFDYPSTDLKTIINKLKGKMILIGGIPTITCLLEGTYKDVFSNSLKLIEEGVDVLAPSCCFVPETSIENIVAINDSIKYWNGKL